MDNKILDKIEKEYSFSLPSQFRKFIQNYEFKTMSSDELLISGKKKIFLANDIFIKELINTEDYAAIAKQSNNFITHGGLDFHGFSSIESMFKQYESDDFIKEESLLMIGSWGSGDSTINVGYGKDNYDQIFIENDWFRKKPIRKIADSILEIVPYFRQYCCLPNIDINELYKKKDEDFWRKEYH